MLQLQAMLKAFKWSGPVAWLRRPALLLLVVLLLPKLKWPKPDASRKFCKRDEAAIICAMISRSEAVGSAAGPRNEERAEPPPVVLPAPLIPIKPERVKESCIIFSESNACPGESTVGLGRHDEGDMAATEGTVTDAVGDPIAAGAIAVFFSFSTTKDMA